MFPLNNGICEVRDACGGWTWKRGRPMLPLYCYRDKEKREVDLIIEESGTLYPVEIKTTSDPNKASINAFKVLQKIPDKQIGEGAVIAYV